MGDTGTVRGVNARNRRWACCGLTMGMATTEFAEDDMLNPRRCTSGGQTSRARRSAYGESVEDLVAKQQGQELAAERRRTGPRGSTRLTRRCLEKPLKAIQGLRG